MASDELIKAKTIISNQKQKILDLQAQQEKLMTIIEKVPESVWEEIKANKYTFVWRKTVEKNKAKLQAKVSALLKQIDDVIIQDKIGEEEPNAITAAVLSDIVSELKESLKKEEEQADDVKKKP